MRKERSNVRETGPFRWSQDRDRVESFKWHKMLEALCFELPWDRNTDPQVREWTGLTKLL